MSTSTSEFKKLIEKCRKDKSPKLIYNASIDHARDLFLELLKEAEATKANVKIVSGFLTDNFYGPLSDDIRKLMDTGVTIQLVVLTPDVQLKKHAFSACILEKKGKVFQSNEKVNTPHYILVGDCCFRLETDHNQAKAVASFNSPEIAQMLEKNFDKLKKHPSIHELTKEPSKESLTS